MESLRLGRLLISQKRVIGSYISSSKEEIDLIIICPNSIFGMGDRDYWKALREAATILKSSSKDAIVIFHDDADGLCAGAIASLALDRIGVSHRLVCIEKLSPEIVDLIHSLSDKLYLYLDIGSGRADLIARKLDEKPGLAIIVDHHDPASVDHEKLLHLNPELYGYSGESDVSGSTATYLLMRELVDLRDAAWMAVIGSAEIPGNLKELNRIPLNDAVERGDVQISRAGGSERYLIKPFGKPWNKLSSTLTAIGSAGYYARGPQQAVESLKERRIPEELAERFEKLRRRKFAQAFAIISKGGLRHEKYIQWYHLGDLFKGLGSKTIGTLTSMLSYRRGIDQKKYLIGFMNFEPEIPGLGRLKGEWVKVSVRAPKPLQRLIEKDEMPAISDLTMRAAERAGGSGDGHRFAASALIPAGGENVFLEEYERLVAEYKAGGLASG